MPRRSAAPHESGPPHRARSHVVPPATAACGACRGIRPRINDARLIVEPAEQPAGAAMNLRIGAGGGAVREASGEVGEDEHSPGAISVNEPRRTLVAAPRSDPIHAAVEPVRVEFTTDVVIGGTAGLDDVLGSPRTYAEHRRRTVPPAEVGDDAALREPRAHKSPLRRGEP